MVSYFGGQVKTDVVFPIWMRNTLYKKSTVLFGTTPVNFTGAKFDINIWDGNTIILNISSYGATPYITLGSSTDNFIINVPLAIVNAKFTTAKDYFIEGIYTSSTNITTTWWQGIASVRDKK